MKTKEDADRFTLFQKPLRVRDDVRSPIARAVESRDA
jgi:hypothetical protein